MITISSKGDFNKTNRFLSRMGRLNLSSKVAKYGQEGVRALSSATPQSTGLAASSWGYSVKTNSNGFSLTWTNSDIENGFPVAVMIQYGHGTKNGGYVQGIDYINPAIRPIFERILNELWKEVTAE